MLRSFFVAVLFVHCGAAYAETCGRDFYMNDGVCLPCPDGLHTFDGADEVTDCGPILHVGDDIVYLRQDKRSSPAFCAKLNDKTFYAMMHRTEIGKLRAQFNGLTYSIHDERFKYYPVDYIYFDRHSYIELGFPPSADLNFEIKAQWDAKYMGYDAALFGASPSTSASAAEYKQYTIFYSSNQGNMHFWPMLYGNGFKIYAEDEPQVIRFDNHVFSINDTVYKINFNPPAENPTNLILGGVAKVNGVDNRMFIGRVFYAHFWDSNGDIINLVPVLDLDGVPCMYDTVSKSFFYNQGTGTFLY